MTQPKAKSPTRKPKAPAGRTRVPRAAKGIAAALDPDAVLPPESDPDAQIIPGSAASLRRPGDLPALERLEASITRDVVLANKLDKAGAMVGIKIGLALQSAKSLLKHGLYEDWVEVRFGEKFSKRRAQYYHKMAKVFLQSAEAQPLQVPPPQEAGNWLVVSDDGSALQKTVEAFVGDRSFGELLDAHNIKTPRKQGGWKPSPWLVAQYQGENPHLQGRIFDFWSAEDQEKFKVWMAAVVEADDGAAAVRMAAESTWHRLRTDIADHGISRKSWKLLSLDQLEETRDCLDLVLRDIRKALKSETATQE